MKPKKAMAKLNVPPRRLPRPMECMRLSPKLLESLKAKMIACNSSIQKSEERADGFCAIGSVWVLPSAHTFRLLAASFALLCSSRVARAETFRRGSRAIAWRRANRCSFRLAFGGRQNVQPPDISVEGLDVQYVRLVHSTQMRIENGRMTSSSTLTHIYQVPRDAREPLRCPALDVEVDGKSFAHSRSR